MLYTLIDVILARNIMFNPLIHVTKKKIKKNLEGLTRLSSMADNALMLGNISDEEHKDLKGKIRDAGLDNIFAAMAAYCSK